MEDPKRMRTKLRLDLADVRKQIEDLEELLKKDESPENVEAHRKLVEYEKKLKSQYEKLTGLDIEQATQLGSKDTVAPEQVSKLGAILGILAGLLISYGFYNSLLHSIEGYDPVDVMNFFSGTGKSVVSVEIFFAGLMYETSLFLVTIPIAVGALFAFLSAILDKQRNRFLGILEGLALLGTTGFLSYVLFSTDVYADAANFMIDSLLIYTIIIGASGIVIFLAAFGHDKFSNKFMGILYGLTFLGSAAQLYLISLATEADIPDLLVSDWPYIVAPIIIGSGLYAFSNLLKFLRG